jgi:FAD/FMN-containing dehydrogenase
MNHRQARRQFLKGSAGFAGASLLMGSGTAAGGDTPDYYLPGQRGYETARRPFNADIGLQPGVIAACENDAQVSTAVQRARAEGLPISVKSRGHSFEGFSLNDGGLVIELSRLARPVLTPDGRFQSGPGMTLGDVYSFLLPKGRLLPAGSCSGVGLGGLTLGGGYGLFSRQFGLTCDHLERVRMVDGLGQVIDSETDPDLLWACQGGGNGNFGAITAMEFRTVPAPAQLSAQRFKAGPLSVTEMLAKTSRWFEMAKRLPDPIFSAFVANGKQVTVLLTSTAAASGPSFQAAVAALKEAGFTSKGATVGPLQESIKRYYGVQTPLPFRNFCGGMADGFEDYAPALPAVFEESQSAGLIVQFNTLGGAITRGSGGAYAHRARLFLCEVQAYWEASSLRGAKVAAAEKVREILGARVPAHYRNYPSVNFPNWEQAYYGENYARLQLLKQRYDPENLFRHPQSVRLPSA